MNRYNIQKYIILHNSLYKNTIYGIIRLLCVTVLCEDTGELVAMMQGHSSTIHAISVHTSGHHAMTTSTDTAQLWDLDSFQRKRKLTVKEDVPIVKVCCFLCCPIMH